MELFLNTMSFLLGFIIVIIVIPPILNVAHAKGLFDPLSSRKVHKNKIPPMGGVAIFLGFLLSTIISTGGYIFFELKYIIAGVLMMFFIGLVDDLMDILARKKFLVQTIAAAMLIVLGRIQITNLHGIFGIYEIHYVTGFLLTLFIILAIINAYNLIDGIDGLASGLGMLAGTVFGIWFFISGNMVYAIMSFALVGSLAGFFLFNVFGKKNKLFMGDTGSLIVGLLIAVLVIKFNEFNIGTRSPMAIGAAPAVSFAAVAIPLIDMLRVITIRILDGRSPFSADNNHVHHRILAMQPSHLKVTLIMLSTNVMLVLLALLSNHLSFDVTIQFLIIFSFSLLLSFIPGRLLKVRQSITEKKTSLAHRNMSRILHDLQQIK